MQMNHACMLSCHDQYEGSTKQPTLDCTNCWYCLFVHHGSQGWDNYDGFYDVATMFSYIDTNGNQSCLHALQLWSVWGFHQTTLSRLHKLLILTIPDKLETMIVGAMMSNVLIYRYKCKWIMHGGSPAMISMRVPASNPLWIAQISNFGFLMP